MQQQTLKKAYNFIGKGLHTGKVAEMTIYPAPKDYGIRFVRTDIRSDIEIEAIGANVTSTARSTMISSEGVSVTTVEHVLSALTGMGVDNARIEINNVEVPIIDGSAKPYIDAMWKDGFVRQDAERKYIEIKEPIEVRRDDTGAYLLLEPSNEPFYDLTIDFNSRVLGVQHAHWDPSVSYVKEIGLCRTFVFFDEIECLFRNNLVKGGDLDNAIVIVENPVSPQQIEHMSKLFNVPKLVVSEGYLSNLQLRFSNECARHKMLDLIGDLRLVGGFLKAKITAYKSGHHINVMAVKRICEQQKYNLK